MVKTPSFKRLILRPVLRQVSPMVIRLVSVSDEMPLHEFHDVFRTILRWNSDLGDIFRVHDQEVNSFRRKTLSKALHMWEWDVRVLEIQEGVEGDHAPVCVGGRGAAPPEFWSNCRHVRSISGIYRANGVLWVHCVLWVYVT